MTRLARADVVAAIRGHRRLGDDPIEIACEATPAIGHRDWIELYLALCGPRQWTWRDPRGRTLERQATGRIVANLTRDLARWAGLVTRLSRRLATLERDPTALAPARLAAGAKVLYLRTDHWFNLVSGGSVGHVRGVIDGFRAAGFDPEVVSTDRLAGVPTGDRFHLCEPDYGLGRNLPEIPEILHSATVASFATARWPELKPAFVYQRLSLGNFAGPELKARHGVPYVCEYNGSFAWMARHWSGRRHVHRRLVARIEAVDLRSADLVVVVSNASRDELAGRGFDPARILVNPNGVDPERYSPEVDGDAVRRRHDLKGKTVLGFIGTFGPWHGAEVLADAFSRLVAADPERGETLRLLLIGDGPALPAVRARLAAAGLAGSAVFTGLVAQDEGPAHLAACDILVSPHVANPDGTRFFGSPTKLFEYLAMGKPIVASDLDQVGEVLTHDVTAWLVPPGDPAALAAGLAALVADPARRARLALAARAAAVARHTWRQHAERIVGAVRERCRR